MDERPGWSHPGDARDWLDLYGNAISGQMATADGLVCAALHLFGREDGGGSIQRSNLRRRDRYALDDRPGQEPARQRHHGEAIHHGDGDVREWWRSGAGESWT